MKESWDLASLLGRQKIPSAGLYKCRVLYDSKDVSIEFTAYQPRPVHSLMIVYHDSISYDYKFADRTLIDELFLRRNGCDDILIVRRGFVTDASYANVLFKLNDKWVTPSRCLLKGTMRQSLLDEGRITERDIRLEDLAGFQWCKLINAMLLDQSAEIPISNVRGL